MNYKVLYDSDNNMAVIYDSTKDKPLGSVIYGTKTHSALELGEACILTYKEVFKSRTRHAIDLAIEEFLDDVNDVASGKEKNLGWCIGCDEVLCETVCNGDDCEEFLCVECAGVSGLCYKCVDRSEY